MQWLAFALDCHATSDLCFPLAMFVQLLPAMSMCRVSRACLAVTVACGGGFADGPSPFACSVRITAPWAGPVSACRAAHMVAARHGRRRLGGSSLFCAPLKGGCGSPVAGCVCCAASALSSALQSPDSSLE